MSPGVRGGTIQIITTYLASGFVMGFSRSVMVWCRSGNEHECFRVVCCPGWDEGLGDRVEMGETPGYVYAFSGSRIFTKVESHSGEE